jgi:hypothetical protein
MFLDAGAGCTLDPCPDCSVVIDYSGVDTSIEGKYPYTVTCKREGCTDKTATGEVEVAYRCCPCQCDAVAPPICACLGEPLTDAEFIANGARCDNCGNVQPLIDDSGVDYNKLGLQHYTVTCISDNPDCPDVTETGDVCVRDWLYGPVPGSYGSGIIKSDQNYDAGTVTVKLDDLGYLVVDAYADQNTANCGDWTFNDCGSLYIGVTPPPTCAPGQFPYKVCTFEPTHIQYKVLLTSIPGYVCSEEPMLYLALHVNMDSNCVDGQTSWAYDQGGCVGGCDWDKLGQICFQIDCNSICPKNCCPPCK